MRTTVPRLLSTLAAVVVAATGFSPPARANTASDDVDQLQEVVVTAERRTASSQTTPIAINVYSAEDISRKGIVDVASLTNNDTSLNMVQALGGSEPYLTLRGVSSSDTTELGDPAIGVATDGFFKNRTYDLLGSLYDVERIEVLRGPQGTLYGRNTAGGVVNIITNKPGNEFETSASVEVGNYSALNFTGMLNLPFSDVLRMRAAFASNAHDGYRRIDMYPGLPSEGGDDQDARSGRIEVGFTPAEYFEGLFTYQALQLGGTGGAYELLPFVANPAVPGDISHALPNVGDSHSWTNYAPTWLRLDEKTYKLQLTYSGLPGGAQLVYLGGYDNLQFHHSDPLNGFLGIPFNISQTYQQNEYPKTYSHELRVVSPNAGRFTWQGGVYFFEERSTNLDTRGYENPGATDVTQVFAYEFPLVESTSRALYGQGSFKLTDAVSLSAGVRYTRDTKERTGVFDFNYADAFGISQYGSARSSKTTWHAGVDWQPTDNMFEYAKVDTGYKAGGFTTCNPYGPETVTAYEIGSKNRFAQNTGQLNLAAFFNNYTNQQFATLVSSDVCLTSNTVENAGGSHIYGLEGDFQKLVDPVGKFNLSFTYLHARFTNFVAAPGLPAAAADCSSQAGNGNCQLAGNTLPNSPTLTVSAGLEHTWHLPGDVELNARVEEKYTSRQYYSPFNYASTTSPGYGISNLYFDFIHENWRVGLWGRNLANKTYFSNMQEWYVSNAYQYSFGPPRTYGIRFEYSTK